MWPDSPRSGCHHPFPCPQKNGKETRQTRERTQINRQRDYLRALEALGGLLMTSSSIRHSGGVLGVREEWRRLREGRSGMRFRGPVLTDMNRVKRHDEISPDAAKAGREGNHISIAVEGERCLLSHSHQVPMDGTQRVLPMPNPIIWHSQMEKPGHNLCEYRWHAAGCHNGNEKHSVRAKQI